jgi:hypothetical protein
MWNRIFGCDGIVVEVEGKLYLVDQQSVVVSTEAPSPAEVLTNRQTCAPQLCHGLALYTRQRLEQTRQNFQPDCSR